MRISDWSSYVCSSDRKAGGEGKRDGEEALHVRRAAAVEPAFLLRRLEGVGCPILAVDGYDIGVAGEHDAGPVGRAERRVEVGLALLFVVDEAAFDAELAEVVLDEADQGEVRIAAGRVVAEQLCLLRAQLGQALDGLAGVVLVV